MNIIILKLSAHPPHSVFVPCISIEPGPKNMTTLANVTDIGFMPMNVFLLPSGSLDKIQKI